MKSVALLDLTVFDVLSPPPFRKTTEATAGQIYDSRIPLKHRWRCRDCPPLDIVQNNYCQTWKRAQISFLK